METEATPADTIRLEIEAFVAKMDYRAAVVQCQELEILTASAPFGQQHEDAAKVHMALLLVQDDVNNARHLWRRLPPAAKAEGGDMAALWGVGKCLWQRYNATLSRDMGGAQKALREREWSPPMASYATLIDARVRERQLNMISKAFTALPLEKVASMLAFSVEDAEKECAKEGWEIVGTGAERTVNPKPRVGSDGNIPTTTPDYLQKMAKHIAFLERRNQG